MSTPSLPVPAPSRTRRALAGEVDRLVARLIASRRYGACITAHKIQEARPGAWRPVPDWVHPSITAALAAKSISRLYSHQADALDHVRAGQNVVAVTPTASGKTLCYNLPVLQAMLDAPGAKALYLFPTKALAQDQVAELHDLITHMGADIKTFTYDGDTPDDARRAIRTRGDIVVTNPDMLHTAILPHHTKWVSFFEHLKFVVLDELHTYRGVFGSHVANLIRRLKRICAFYGAAPQFICASATIANPKELAEALVEAPVALVDRNGAPSGMKHLLFYNPPVINPQLGIRAGATGHTRRLASLLLRRGVQTIVFAGSRLTVEVLTKYLKDVFRKEPGPGEDGLVRGYRGGYLPARRREIERGLREGAILGVVSTNALELGVDIGGLDAAVLCGYPGSIASTWQQAGRAGRRQDVSCVILVASSRPLDQYIVSHPDYFFGSSPEHGRINPENLLILVSHVECAAFELPFREGETFGRLNLPEILEYLAEKGILHHSGAQWTYVADAYPASQVSLRSVSAENVVILADHPDGPQAIAEADFHGAPLTLYPGAIYMVESQAYQVKTLEMDRRRAYVVPAEVDYYTDAIDYTKVRILETFERAETGAAPPEHGEVHVVTHVAGFKKIKFYTAENAGYGEVNLPDQEMHTTAYWLTVPQPVLGALGLTRAKAIDGLLGLGYAMHTVAALILMADGRDLGRAVGDKSAEWMARQTALGRGIYTSAGAETSAEALDRFEPTIFLYDQYPGGIGLAPQLYDSHKALVEGARDLITACPCETGCPSCVGPLNEVGQEAKGTALALARRLLEN